MVLFLICVSTFTYERASCTHRLHADEIRQNIGTFPNSARLCHTYRVNAGQIFFEIIAPFHNSPTNRVSSTMPKAAGLFFSPFPLFMLKRRRRCPNSTILLLFFPIFRSCCPPLHDKAGSLYVDLCQNKNKNPAVCCPYIQPMMKQGKCYFNSTHYL